MGKRVKEIDLLEESVTPESPLFDTTWLEKQFYKKQYVFNIMCVGRCSTCLLTSLFDPVDFHVLILE